MDIFNIQALIRERKVVELSDIDPTSSYLQVGVFQTGNRQSNASNADTYPSYAISISELLATPPITLNVIPRGTGPSIADGFWAFSANDIYPLTPCSNIGLPTNRIQTLYMCSEIDYTSDLLFKTGANTVATITTDSRLILNYPAVGLPLANWGHTFAAPAGSVMAFHVGTSGLAGGLLTINVDGSFGIGNLAGPIHTFAGNGLDIFSFTGAINNQKVGINTLSPSATLHLKGVDSVSSSYSLKIDDVAGNPLFSVRNDGQVNSNDGYSYNGNRLLQSDFFLGNNFLGSYGFDNTPGNTGTFVNAIGYGAGQSNTGNSVSVMGEFSGLNNTGINVIGLGPQALQGNTGNNVFAAGYQAGLGNTGNNVFGLGNFSIYNNTVNDAVIIGSARAASAAFLEMWVGVGPNKAGTEAKHQFVIRQGSIATGVIDNSMTNVDLIFAGAVGTGTGRGGALKMQVAPASGVSSGVQNTLVDVFIAKQSSVLNLPAIQTGNAGLVTGDLYVDTAANVLANGDLVVARKV